MFTLAVQAGRLSTRPHIPMLEENNARQGFVDHESFLALQDTLPEHLKDPVAFLYLSGWRVSEMRGLEWRDVDLPGRVIRLRPELSKNKTGRVLPLSGDLLDVIARAAERRRLDCPAVFHVDGQAIGDFRVSWQRACVATGLGAMLPTGQQTPTGEPILAYKGLTPHDLRRSAVRNMLRAGIAERVCMALSGHKTRAIFDRYNIVSEADLTEAAPPPAICSIEAAVGTREDIPHPDRSAVDLIKDLPSTTAAHPGYPLCTLRARSYPRPAQHLVLAVGRLCQAGLATRWAPINEAEPRD